MLVMKPTGEVKERYQKRFERDKSEIYNAEIKQEYIFTINEHENRDKYTPNTIMRIFKAASRIEEQLKKDLYDFNINEFEILFSLLAPSTQTASLNNVSLTSKYLEWAITKGYLKTGVNYLSNISPSWKTKFENKNIKMLWTDREIKKIVQSRVNFQDKVIIMLLFHGIQGKAFSEIINLTKYDVSSGKNMINVYNEETGSRRDVLVDEYCTEVIMGAIAETEYQKKNGAPGSNTKSVTAKLVENDYVVRLARARTINTGKVTTDTIHRRLLSISKEIEESHFNPTTIYRSGVMAQAYNLYLEQGEFNEQLKSKIYGYFNITSYFIKKRWENEFLNYETLVKLYQLS